MVEKLGFAGKMKRERISDYERREREPVYDVLLAYGRIAGVYVDVLIDDELDLPDKLPVSPKSPGIPHPPTPTRRTLQNDS